MSYIKDYFDHVAQLLDKAAVTQESAITAAAHRLVDTVTAGNRVYFFGCTHAGILAQEAFYRTGGLAVINPLFPPGLTCDVIPITLTSRMERMEGYGTDIVSEAGLNAGDLLFIHSVSGRNAVTIDMAIAAHKLGVYVVAFTSLYYSRASTARHSSGKRLFECADLVIDNGGEVGDACIALLGFPQKVSPTSTVVGAALLNAMVAEAAAEFLRRGIAPPVFMSANLDGGDAFNAQLMETYRDRIRYL